MKLKRIRGLESFLHEPPRLETFIDSPLLPMLTVGEAHCVYPRQDTRKGSEPRNLCREQTRPEGSGLCTLPHCSPEEPGTALISLWHFP